MNWTRLQRFAAITVMAIGATACDNRPGASSAGANPAAPASTSPVDPATALRADYFLLAASLADPMMDGPNEPSWQKDLSQVVAEGQVKILALRGIAGRTADQSARFIATEAAESGDALLKAHQSMATLSQDDGLGKLLWLGAGLWLGQPGMVLTGTEGLLTSNDAYSHQKGTWVAAFVRSRAAQLMLPSVAQRCAGEAGDGEVLAIDVDESFAGSAAFDSLTLTNATKGTLHNCTVLVELRGASGDVSQNVHFVRAWEPSSRRYAHYGIGVGTPSGPVGRQTVYGIQEARVSVWAEELRNEGQVYKYPGPERDRDIAAMLEGKMQFRTAYVPMPLFGSGRRMDLTLDGVPSLPAHTVTMHFRHGTETKTKLWPGGDWPRGQLRHFDTGSGFLAWDPESVDVEIGFADSAYVWRDTVKINTRGAGGAASRLR